MTLFLTIRPVIKDIKSKKKSADNHNILRLFDALPTFLSTTSEAVPDYYLPNELPKELRLRILGNYEI